MPLKKLIKSAKKKRIKHPSDTSDLGIDGYFRIFLIYPLFLNFLGLSLVVSAIYSLTPAFSSVTWALTLDRYAFYGPVQYELAIMVRMAMNLTLIHCAFPLLVADVIRKKLIKSAKKKRTKHPSDTSDLGIDGYFRIFLIYPLFLNFLGLSLVVSAIYSLTPAFSSVTWALTLDRYAFYGPVQYELAIMVRMAMNLTLIHCAFPLLVADVIRSKVSIFLSMRAGSEI